MVLGQPAGLSKEVCLYVDAGWLKLICEYGGREQRSVLVAIPCGCRLLVSSHVTTYVYYLWHLYSLLCTAQDYTHSTSYYLLLLEGGLTLLIRFRQREKTRRSGLSEIFHCFAPKMAKWDVFMHFFFFFFKSYYYRWPWFQDYSSAGVLKLLTVTLFNVNWTSYILCNVYWTSYVLCNVYWTSWMYIECKSFELLLFLRARERQRERD